MKPNTLGAKLGIGRTAASPTVDAALGPAARIRERYGDRALTQAYVAGPRRAGELHGSGRRRPAAARRLRDADGRQRGLPDAGGFAADDPAARGRDGGAASRWRSRTWAGRTRGGRSPPLARRLARGLGLRDYWSIDFRLDEAGRPWFLELEVCPAVTIYDFLTYLRQAYGVGLAEALARAAPVAFGRRRGAMGGGEAI